MSKVEIVSGSFVPAGAGAAGAAIGATEVVEEAVVVASDASCRSKLVELYRRFQMLDPAEELRLAVAAAPLVPGDVTAGRVSPSADDASLAPVPPPPPTTPPTTSAASESPAP